MKRFWILLLWFGLLPVSKALAGDIQVVMPRDVRMTVTGLFRSPEMRAVAKDPKSKLYRLIGELEKAPLFMFAPTDDPESRLNFTALYRLLSLRHVQYEDFFLGDLYLLHELTHIATMPYERNVTDYNLWRDKLETNEKESAFHSEVIFYFHHPDLRQLLKIDRIWVDRFLNEEVQLKTDESNWDFFKRNPVQFEIELSERFVGIGRTPPSQLDGIERRSWVFDRGNLIFTQNYWPYAPVIERHMHDFLDIAKTDPEGAAQFHLEWLEGNTANGIVLRDPNHRNHLHWGRLNDSAQGAVIGDFAAHTLRLEERQQQLVAEGKVQDGPSLEQHLKLIKYGVTNTVYAVPYPETRLETMQAWANFDFDELYGDAYLRVQDEAHLEVLGSYRAWASPVVKGLEHFPHAYPANGSSEAMKDTLGVMKTQNPKLRVHVFKGEYEGMKAYTSALGIKLVEWDRNHPQLLSQISKSIRPREVFYLSQPSGIDGNVWEGYADFMRSSQRWGIDVLVDLAYVGTVARNYNVDLNYPHIHSVFFSLSKAFGVYYKRMGGVFSKFPNDLLMGNKWFKNMESLQMAATLLKNYGIYYFPRSYQWAQIAALQEFNHAYQLNFSPSDVILLGHRPIDPKEKGKYPEALQGTYRGTDRYGYLRVALTPTMDALIRQNRDKCQIALAD